VINIPIVSTLVRESRKRVHRRIMSFKIRRDVRMLLRTIDERGTAGSTRSLTLGVVGGYPILEYIDLGYDWVGSYYNPMLTFQAVHYFQTAPTCGKLLDWGYPFYIHSFSGADSIVRVCKSHRIDILRAYDSVNGRVAIQAGRELNIPVIVSVH